jgi:nitrogenase molybdenum-iron protein NifN
MPLGAVTAFKGIESSMVILHGSQGCSTYIRRHMAGHYNEPIDIASSSLNEEGTVYGGEKNLKKGLKNLIQAYRPKVIGVATTCLAETIGEDIRRITEEFAVQEKLEGIEIIPVSTPGYGATQFEGYYTALTEIVKKVAVDTEQNGKINIITGNISPGDVRNIKRMLNLLGVEYILLPDVSITLDAVYKSRGYTKIPEGGTRVEDIRKMAGAAATVEMGMTVMENMSPGKYLQDEYQVPLYRCPLPIGVKNTDTFIRLISDISGKPVPPQIQEERGRLLDGMIDSHKYNGEGRAVIYGEPELVYAVAGLCLENGIKPVLISSGSRNDSIQKLLESGPEYPEEKILIIDDTDFETIQEYAVKLKSNILIGNSDGKIITEKEGIPLVRIGFPIHDRVGGQRLVYTGYDGSLKLLDDITNTLLENKYEKYRQSMFERYYAGGRDNTVNQTELKSSLNQSTAEKTENHPCFSSCAAENARMHIPVAPACNISCNYCSRKYDCLNESRPGVTSQVLTPEEAAIKFVEVRKKLDNLKVVGIAGPGDALANFENTARSIQLIKEVDGEIIFCLSTNGLMLPYYADEILNLGVTHITVTINAVDPGIGEKIYREVNYMGRKITGVDAAKILIKNQLDGLKYMASKGVACKVNIVMIKGINDSHIGEVVKKVKECGAVMTNIMPLIPAPGSVFENMPLTNSKELNELRKKCEIDIKQMYHCKQCRADAIGVLGEDISAEFRTKGCGGCSMEVENNPGGTYTFAVASKTGMMIDEHFGHVEEFYIYKSSASGTRFLEKRSVAQYCGGEEECDDGETKLQRIIDTIGDCDAVLVLRIGYRPSKILQDKGIRVIQTCGEIEDGIKYAVKQLYIAKNRLGSAV